MSEVNYAEQIVKTLKVILGEDTTGKEDYDLEKFYISPIVTPLKKLKDFQGVGIENDITIDERVEVSIYKKTLVMRKELANLLNPSPDKESLSDNKRNLIAKWIVEVWGGIPSGKDDVSLFECIELADETSRIDQADEARTVQFDFNRVASWSKYLAFKNPEKYAIYDARVIYSLNWLLYQSGGTQYFPFLSGRNSVMELLDYQLYLFLGNNGSHVADVQTALESDIRNRRKSKTPEQVKSEPSTKSYFSNRLKKRRDLFVSDKDAFSKYCGLLQEISQELFDKGDTNRLTKTEMLLFAIADAEIAESVLKYISSLVAVER